mmetsp:Transcript_5645/g.5598  ORF Transcript_5645/g.5598 Transcript_5645/m.5598 type:complete len:404 (-) Transcript_5645:2696-3907(-)
MTIDTPVIYKIRELTPREKELIKASIPILEQSGDVLTSKFYNHMLTDFPEVRPFFNESHQKDLKQPKILAFALLNYAKNIDDLAPLTAFVNQIVVKHVGLQVKPEHYPIVGKCILETMSQLLGPDTATEEFLTAWATAYGNLAQILINAEAEKYKAMEWDGFRDFKISRIENESKDVKSIYFKAADGGKIAMPKRGQYVCIRFKLPNSETEKSREYSLSQYPSSDEYRISVRLVEGGQISPFIHDGLRVGSTIRVSPPAGQFIYRESDVAKPLVLFVGGIGITPLVSMTEKALESGRQVYMLNSNRLVETRPFTQWLQSLKKKYGDKFKLIEFISNESEKNLQAIDKLETRRLEAQDFGFVKPEFDYYMLGPNPYMKFVKGELLRRGVEESDIASEFFGPMEV